VARVFQWTERVTGRWLGPVEAPLTRIASTATVSPQINLTQHRGNVVMVIPRGQLVALAVLLALLSRGTTVLAAAPRLGNCSPTTQTFSTETPVPIPEGPAVVSSTITVSGAGPSLWDVDLTTFIRHTFAADLDITLTSPQGTVVTITTDNGAGNADVFNGTVWDDQANPEGQVPYTTNGGLATDHPYVNLTPAASLVPEEALAAFRGEDPNGEWTLTISDDAAGDGGTLDSWSLAITTFPAPPAERFVTVSNAVPTTIPAGPSVVTSTISVPAGAGRYLVDVNVTTSILHTFAADLDITLTSPQGIVVTLTTDNGAGNDHVFNGTVWDDQANPGGQVPYITNSGLATDHPYVNLTPAASLVPEEALAAFNGLNAMDAHHPRRPRRRRRDTPELVPRPHHRPVQWRPDDRRGAGRRPPRPRPFGG
jgi:subtilisin-like proprotein convertase family protein